MTHMRKLFALAMVAILALGLAFVVMGCGKKAEETPATSTESTPSSSTMSDSTMHAESTMAKPESTMAK